ncbi:MAG TPA: DUF1501 domain-containing protein [Acidobacteriota bacterium]|nr:DUF1501 domain-containing protein [Acidobacteriota bacterium]
MKRRDFLKNLTFLSSALCAPTFLVNSIKAAKAQGITQAATAAGRKLLVVELAGGNDGLNTIIPYTNDFYRAQRPLLGIPSADVLDIDGTYGMHPAMTDLRDLWDQGVLAAVHGVGYPNPNRSHFRSSDIWHTAAPEVVAKDGWLAKHLDDLDSQSTLDALAIGGGVPKAMISSQGASPAIQSIETFQLDTDFTPGDGMNAPYPDGSNINAAFQQVLSQPQNRFGLQEFVGRTALDATLASIELLEGDDSYSSTVEYPDTAFAENLRTVARVMAADLGVSVYYVTIGGFDTHAEQTNGNPLQGVHTTLLQTVSQGLAAFWQDMQQLGFDQDVLVMSFSEFGRRLFENASDGTDHGTANQMFLLGGRVIGGFHGQHPSLAPGDLDQIGDMKFTQDFRGVYATVLENWLGGDAAAVLGESWPTLDVLDV